MCTHILILYIYNKKLRHLVFYWWPVSFTVVILHSAHAGQFAVLRIFNEIFRYISMIYYHQESKTFNLVYLINLNVQTHKMATLEVLKLSKLSKVNLIFPSVSVVNWLSCGTVCHSLNFYIHGVTPYVAFKANYDIKSILLKKVPNIV